MNLKKIPLYVLGGAAGFFVVTFGIYYFNLDMKAVSLLDPWFEKHYDNLPRKQYV